MEKNPLIINNEKFKLHKTIREGEVLGESVITYCGYIFLNCMSEIIQECDNQILKNKYKGILIKKRIKMT